MVYEKYRGPQFIFNESVMKNPKEITVHIDVETQNKLLLVVKKRFDQEWQKEFWNVELETLPYRDNESKGKHCITTFLHGKYYPDMDCFMHIDCAKNQYDIEDYVKKYSDCMGDVPIDFHTTSKALHHKIWCVENGKYSRRIWYDLMVVSLNKKYAALLDEMLAKTD